MKQRVRSLIAEIRRLRRVEQFLRDSLGTMTVPGSDSGPATGAESRSLMLLELGCRNFNLECGALLRLEGDELRALNTAGCCAPDKCGSLPAGHPIIGHVLESGEPVCFRPDPGMLGNFPEPLSKARTLFAARLSRNGAAVGLLLYFTTSSAPHEFTETEREMMALLAQWASADIVRIGVERERDRLITRLEEEQATLHQLVRNAPVAMAMFDDQLRYLTHSRKWLEDYGLGDRDIIGLGHYEVFPEIPQRWKSIHSEALAGEVKSCDEDVFYRSDGSRQVVRWALQPWRRPDNTVGGIIMVTEDRTLVVRSREEAIAASRAKSAFLATVSHEIRTPLNGVMGMLSLLMKTDLTNRQQHFVDAIESSANALLILLNDILDFSRIEAGRISLNNVDFNLRTLYEDAVALMRPGAEEKGLKLELKLPENTPPLVHGDSGRVRQILLNLLNNAIKFTAEGSVVVQCDLSGNREDEIAWRTSVTDSGRGIPAHRMNDLFSPFSQIESDAGTSGGGTGLGLAICRQLVELAGGRISAESMAGKGSTFSFVIPFRMARKPDGTGTRARGKGPVDRQALGLTVLVAEDNPINQEVTTELLRANGCEPVLADDGREALQLASYRRFDAVLMDCQMPHMDGLQATRRIRALPGEYATVPVIALTASVTADDRDACLAAGMDGFLPKPLDEAELCAALRQVAAGRSPGLPEPAEPEPEEHSGKAGGQLIDPARLLAVCGSDTMLRDELLKLARRELALRMEELRDAVRARDFARIDQLSHRMAGGAENIGAMSFGRAAREVRCAAQAKSLCGVRETAGSLDGLHRELDAELEQVISSVL